MALSTDLRHSLRLLGNSPVFTLTAVFSLALGIGAAATIFSLTDALLFEPTAGVRDADRVIDVGRANDGSGFDNMSHPSFRYLRDHSQTVNLSAVDFASRPMSLLRNNSSERVFGSLVSGNYFDVMGTIPALGRFFRADEDQVPGERPVVVLSHALWSRRFESRPDIVGSTIRLNNHDFAVIGVAEEGFQGSSLVGTDLWVPMAMVQVARGLRNANDLTEPRSVWHVAVGRLKDGIDARQAEAELNTLMEAYKKVEPTANQRHTIKVEAMGRIPGPVRTPFLAFIGFLFALTGALLAIACSNVAGMMLARAVARRREIATRLAIGASRGRLVAQLLTENAVLFAAAAAIGIPLTAVLVSVLESFLPALPIALNLDFGVSWRVVLFALGLASLTAVVFGLAPARHALDTQLAPMLHGANATADRSRLRLRNGLVAVQVGLSLMLVATAFLFLRSLSNAAATDPGFATANIQIATVDVSLSGYHGQDAVALAGRYLERLRAIDGVESVAHARMIPLQGSGFGMGGLRVPGAESRLPEGMVDADWDVVSSDYFTTLRLPIVEGRAFTAADREGTPFVAVINEEFARQAWPNQSAVGRVVLQELGDNETRELMVVGVAKDAKYRYISSPPAPFIYVPTAQQPLSDVEFYIRHAPGRVVSRDIRSAMALVEPSVPVVMLQSFEDAAAVGLLPQRMTAWIAGSVGTIGIFLAALGLYGLMTFIVVQRTREIAIRMALGASSRDMQSMVLQHAGRLAIIGGVIGLALAGAVGTLAQSLLVGVPPIDPLVLGSTATLFAVVLALAAWTPARRAAATDPAQALRAE